MQTSREELGDLLDTLASASWAEGWNDGHDGTYQAADEARAAVDAALDEVFAEIDRLREEAARAHPDA
jgi:hypothetical protein